jgi:hypothetical protein
VKIKSTFFALFLQWAKVNIFFNNSKTVYILAQLSLSKIFDA